MKVELASVTKEEGTLSTKEIRALVGRDDPVILEIGANVGDMTLEILRVMPNAKIFAFEPDPRAIEIFKASVKSKNVHLFECAVGDRNGTTVFHQSTGKGQYENWNMSGSIRKPKTHLEVWPEVKFESDIMVPIVRLDDLAEEWDIDQVDLIWTDVQGAESDIVTGGLKTINKARFFYTEYSDDEWYDGQINLQALYASLENFSILRLFSMDVLFENLRESAPLDGGSTLAEVSRLQHKTRWLESNFHDVTRRLQNIESQLNSCYEQIFHFVARTLHAYNNVAKGKQATQSSLSQWSTSEGAGGAINGTKTGGFGFHTKLEDSPWWLVDLQAVFEISEILIFNRLDAASERIKTLKVLASTDGETWSVIYDHSGRPAFGGIRPLDGEPPLLITLNEVHAKFVKIQLSEKTFLHLDEVEIYKSH